MFHNVNNTLTEEQTIYKYTNISLMAQKLFVGMHYNKA